MALALVIVIQMGCFIDVKKDAFDLGRNDLFSSAAERHIEQPHNFFEQAEIGKVFK
ncbi:hypothetical protein [Chryseobacterium sp. 3008163]|uniref:hypothetical protein n=1 Tax=Chryseobacterium sp. 3008163 TaxID=2478663 RepID=UPI0013EC5C34|nr:hypothetical protein [Chryseobacterium sp. 3008163]